MSDSASSKILTRPELLAPAGDQDCIRAAVENGADAVYFGLADGFNARARAANFNLENVGEILSSLHRRGVKGYVTLNTLAFTDELAQVETIIRCLAKANVDAVLVQDLGVARMIREIAPGLTIHASTQMTLTSAECIQAVESLGIRRVVLPRELSIDEIRQIHSLTSVELEAFVHGALCVAYSGQCLTSESLGGRSANRGQCAQACRLPYELLCDDELRDLGPQRYLLSPQDLAAYPLTRELIEAGVRCFKIEGRLKTPEYVANITQHYRRAIDDVMSGGPVSLSRKDVQRMEQSFSRGFSVGWLQGCDHKALVPATSSAKRGVLLGTVTAVHRDTVAVDLTCEVRAGDGIVFDGDRYEGNEQGGRIFQVLRQGKPLDGTVDAGIVELTFDRSRLDLSQLWVGQQVWKTDDPRLNQELRKSFDLADPRRKTPVTFTIRAESGMPLRIEGRAANGAVCSVVSELPLQVAQKHSLTRELLHEQLSRLGATIYELQDLDATIVGNPMVPLSVLGKLRRELIQQLETSLPQTEIPVSSENAVAMLRRRLPGRQIVESRPLLTVLCRTPEQVRQVLSIGAEDRLVDCLIADFQDLREYREAILAARNSGITMYTATPRIQKPDEMGLFRLMLKQAPDGVLVRNLSGLKYFPEQGIPVACDYSLNVTNDLTAEYLMQFGPGWLTPSYDLNRSQLMELIRYTPPQWLEVVVHQHMPMFHMEHCVFCAVISPGTNKTNCGRPCDFHKVELRDRAGVDHPLIADVGCRNTLFNATAQSSAVAVPELLGLGVRRFRVELLRESGAEVDAFVRLYGGLIRGDISCQNVLSSLKVNSQIGVTLDRVTG